MATLSRMMKRAASSSNIPLSNRNYISAVFATPLQTSSTIRSISTSNRNTINLTNHVSRATLIPSDLHLSAQAIKKSSSDDALLGLLESVIDWEERFYKVPEAPRDFPFKIEDNPRWNSIVLTRDYQGEVIEASACWPKPPRHYFHLGVSVTKKSGPTLVFDARADEIDEISIDSITVMNPNASKDRIDFSDLDEKLRDAFDTYLYVRGLEPSNIKFIWDYMVRKDRLKYPGWLNNLKSFIEE